VSHRLLVWAGGAGQVRQPSARGRGQTTRARGQSARHPGPRPATLTFMTAPPTPWWKLALGWVGLAVIAATIVMGVMYSM
jgi:hypothetical protein